MIPSLARAASPLLCNAQQHRTISEGSADGWSWRRTARAAAPFHLPDHGGVNRHRRHDAGRAAGQVASSQNSGIRQCVIDADQRDAAARCPPKSRPSRDQTSTGSARPRCPSMRCEPSNRRREAIRFLLDQSRHGSGLDAVAADNDSRASIPAGGDPFKCAGNPAEWRSEVGNVDQREQQRRHPECVDMREHGKQAEDANNLILHLLRPVRNMIREVMKTKIENPEQCYDQQQKYADPDKQIIRSSGRRDEWGQRLRRQGMR
jgi:hypothetical protein